MNTSPNNKAEALAVWSKEAPLQGKLTYVGPQEKPTQTVIFHTGASISKGLFQQFQSPNVSYTNDTALGPAGFSITLEEQGRILTALAGSGLDQNSPDAYWSLILAQADGGQRRGAEWLMDDDTCKRIVRLIASALRKENSAGMQILSEIPL